MLSASVSEPAEEVDRLPKIVALGDMHGDYVPYEALMRDAGLIDGDGNWSGDDTIFVQTGDIPDRGPDTRKIIESLQKLEKQAPLSGGKVIPMVGNHEAMNVYRDLRYVHPGEFTAFASEDSEKLRADYFAAKREAIEAAFRDQQPDMTSDEIKEKWLENMPPGKLEHAIHWSPSGYIGKWVARNRVVYKIGGYLFAHGGYSREYSRFTLDEMNTAASEALRTQDRSRESILRDTLGPLWYRGNVRGRPDTKDFNASHEIAQVLKTYDATHIIVGHTRNEKGIRVSRGGRLIQIDTGASAVYGGVPSYLRIENGEFFAHTLSDVTRLNIAEVKIR
ncbi:metallophosphoesterase [Parasphingorhabdus marina]|nr:metallophosphoesterase [Parasphingorhabdus marina]